MVSSLFGLFFFFLLFLFFFRFRSWPGTAGWLGLWPGLFWFFRLLGFFIIVSISLIKVCEIILENILSWHVDVLLIQILLNLLNVVWYSIFRFVILAVLLEYFKDALFLFFLCLFYCRLLLPFLFFLFLLLRGIFWFYFQLEIMIKVFFIYLFCFQINRQVR